MYIFIYLYMNMDVFLGWRSVESLRHENTPTNATLRLIVDIMPIYPPTKYLFMIKYVYM